MRYVNRLLALGLGLSLASVGLAMPTYVAWVNPGHQLDFINGRLLAFDADKDGKLSKVEVAKGDDRMLVMPRKKLPEFKVAIVKSADVDVLTPNNLISLDRNKDGELTGDELKLIHSAQVAAGDTKHLAIKPLADEVKTLIIRVKYDTKSSSIGVLEYNDGKKVEVHFI